MNTNSNYFKNRKTIRKYQDKPVDETLIYDLLSLSMEAPTTGGMQLYSAIVSTDKAVIKKLAPCHFNQPAIKNAPMVITFCADFNRFVKWCDLSNAKHGYDNFQSFVSALLDVTIFAQQFNTIAEMNGLGCCYLGTTTYNAPDIASVLNLPKLVVPVTTLTVGYPDDDSVKAERLPLRGIVHKNIYSDYSAEQIKEIHAEKESLDINKKYVAENGKENLAQVFTDVRYTKENNELFSEIFYKFIEEQGFHFPTLHKD